MKIEVVNRIPFQDLVERLRAVPLNKPAEDGSKIMIYQNARIVLSEMHPEDVNPNFKAYGNTDDPNFKTLQLTDDPLSYVGENPIYEKIYWNWNFILLNYFLWIFIST